MGCEQQILMIGNFAGQDASIIVRFLCHRRKSLDWREQFPIEGTKRECW